jgi:hypothetical protein
LENLDLNSIKAIFPNLCILHRVEDGLAEIGKISLTPTKLGY